MDGLLVDTEALYIEATESYLAQFGRTVDRPTYISWIGRNVDHEEIRRAFDIPVEPREAWAEIRRRFQDLCHERLTLMPGVLEFLDGPARRYPKAVASSSRHDLIDSHLAQVGIIGRFATRVSAHDVARGKPAPDIFLEAARRLGAEPRSCVVFEDSVYGVAGAKAAGMRAVAVLNTLTRGLDFSAADRVIERLDAVTGAWLAGTEAG